MIKTTNYYIVVFLALILAQTYGYAQYNGGSGDGAHTDPLSLTTCGTPPHFYAYFGGQGDATSTDLLMNTTCGTPPQFYAYMGGSNDGAGVNLLTLTSCSTPPSQFFAYMGGTDDGAAIDNLTLTTCGTPSQFFAYMGGSGDGFKVDSVINCPAIPPVANFSASSTNVCIGSSVNFTDLSANTPSSWNWTFAGGTPGTSTSQNPSVVYNTAGTYNVTLVATNAHGSNSLTMTGYIVVTAAPVANAGTDVSICSGSSATLNASGATTYTWLPATGLSSATIANPVANPTTTTTYTVTGTTSGCSDTDVVIVTVNALPTVSVSPITICEGASGTLTASGAGVYSWAPAAGLSATSGTSVTANPSATTTYTVTGTTVAGCMNTTTVVVTVNPSPVANAGSDVTICNGSSTTLSASGGGSYSWSPATGLSSTTIANPVANPSITRTYTVTVTNIFGCTSTDAVIVTVTPLPSASAGSNVSICNGSSTTLNASGGTSYSWLPASGLSSTTIPNPVANPTTTTTYTVTVMSGGCSATSSVTITVNPVPTVNAGSDVALCNGSSITLAASGFGAYSWSPATGLSSTTISNPIASPTVTTTYTVTLTAGGCSSTDIVLVTVNSLPAVNAGSDVTICNGSSTTLSGSGGPSYSWSPATGLSSTTISNPVANPASTTNYILTVTDLNGCQASDAVVITVNSPAANAGNDVTICTGASTTLSASGGTSYSWSPATGLSSTTIANPVASPTVTTTYTVTVVNSGCSATDIVTVTVSTTLTADAGLDVSICSGSSTTLNSSGGASYGWSPAIGLSSPFISNPVASPSVTTTYTVTVSSAGCSATDVITVTVNPLPAATISASGATTFCDGDSVTLTSSAGASYLWSNGDTTSAITITASGNYSVTVTNASGCSATSGGTSVVVYTVTVSSITPSGPTTFCEGGNVTLTASAGSSYLWSTGDTTQTLIVSLANNYSVSVADINGCSTSSASVNIIVNPNPATPVITANGSTDLCIGDTVMITSDTASSYLWSTGATSASIYATAGGSYSVTNYNSFGCGTTSSSISVNVNDPVADFTATPLLVFIPTANVSFTATTTGVPPYTYLWDFGDGATSTATAPNHIYGTVAYETVALTVTDSTGCSKTITKVDYVEVEQLFPSWSMVTGTSFDLTGVSFLDAVTGIMSLEDGNCLISLDSGNNWSPLPTGNLEPLTGASIIPGNWFVTGENGTILLSTNDGAAWTPFTTGTTETFNGSGFSSSTNGFAVGTNGTIQKYNGVTWTPETSGTLEHLNNVYALSSTEAFAIGDNQTILKYDGFSWAPQSSPTSFNVKDIKFTNANEGYAAGTNGVIIKTIDGGANWTISLSGVDIDFNSVEAVDPDSAWAAGTNGIVYTTIDNGSTWVRYSVGHTATQDEIIVQGGKGHIVGQGGNGRNFGEGRSMITGNTSIQKAINNFNVYPNPTREVFTISAVLSEFENLTVEIKGSDGKLIECIVNSTLSGKYTTTISTEHYRQGVYFIHIKEGEKSWIQKLVIIK